MSDRLQAWFPLALLLTLAALTFWLNQKVQPLQTARDGSNRHDPDYVVENFTATRMGPDGTPRYILSAKKMLHYPDDDTTHLEEPRLLHTVPAKPPLRVSANEALLSSDGEHAYLMGNVKVIREPSGDRGEIEMATSYLHVIPDRNLAETDRPVTITDANTVIDAVGLELDNETHVIKLLSRVKGRYQKPK